MGESNFVDRTKNKIFPDRTPGISRWSPSGVEEYLACGYRFYRRRIDNIRRIRAPMATGKGIHSAAQADNLSRRDKGIGIPLKEAIDLAVSEYDKAYTEAEALDSKPVIDEGRDATVSGATAYATVVAPGVQDVSMVELPILSRHEAPSGAIEIATILDCAVRKAGGIVVKDLKTGKRKKPAGYAHSRGQLSAIGISVQAATGSLPSGYQIDDLYHLKKGWQYQTLQTTRTEEECLSWWDRMMAAEGGVKAGVFPPAPEGSWLCSAKFCEFFGDCKYVTARRRQEVEDGE